MPLTFDIAPILKQIETYLLSAFTSYSPTLRSVIAGYLSSAATRLTDLAEGSLSGQLTGAQVVKALSEEAQNLEDEILSVGEIVGSDVQEIANNAISIFTGSLMDALYAVK